MLLRIAGTRGMTIGALAGIRALDLGIITAGAATSAVLADLGADVIKIEAPNYPDPFRVWAGAEGDSPVFRATNRNKRGLSLNL
jgi:formyl-CoA transferase